MWETDNHPVPFTLGLHYSILYSPISWDCWICQLYLCKGVRLPNECSKYDTEPSDGEVPVLELWGMWSTPSLSLFPGPLRTRVVVPIRVPSVGHIELLNNFLMLLTVSKQMTWDHLTVYKWMNCIEYNY